MQIIRTCTYENNNAQSVETGNLVMNAHSHKISCEACDIEDGSQSRRHYGSVRRPAASLETPDHQFSRLYLVRCLWPSPQFTKGCSPYILDALDLPPNATCEIEEIEDFRGHPDNVTWRRERQTMKKKNSRFLSGQTGQFREM